jgi:hypothetical protein
MKFQPVRTGQPRNKFLIGAGFAPTQLVIEMNNGEDDAKFRAQFEENS